MSFKDSGVEWIGKIPSHWGISKIKYQTDINKHTLNDRTPDDYIIQYIDIGNVNSEGQIQELQQYKFSDAPSRARRIVKKNDLLISTVRTYLKAITSILEDVEDNLICSTGFAVLTPKRTIEPLYLHYLSRSEIYIDEIVSRSTGVSYPAINASDIGALECILPPLNEQHLIGSFLHKKSSEVETIIQSKLKYITLLEQQRQSIITEAVTKGLNPNVNMKDSGVEWIGEIPEHWEKTKMKYVGQAVTGLTYSPEDLTDENGTIVLRSTNIQKGKISLHDNVYVDKEIPNKLLTKKNDILICSRNGSRHLIGKNALIESEINLSFGAFTTVFRSENNDFIYFVLNSNFFEAQLGTYLTSTINQLTIGNLNNMDIVLPPREEQIEIVNYLRKITDSYNEVLNKIEVQIEKLKEYRQALIYEAVTGKIDVRNMELD